MGSFKFDYERAAMRGEEMPNNLTLPDQLCFLGLRMLYAQVRQGVISRERGAEEKGRLLYQRDLHARKLHAGEHLVESCLERERAIAGAAGRYARERTPENADALYEAIWRVGIKNEEE